MAEVVKAVGLKGAVKLLPAADFLPGVLDSPYLRLLRPGGEPEPLTATAARPQGGTVVLESREIATRDAAEAAVGSVVGFLAEDYDRPGFPRPDRPAPFVYLGLQVFTTRGELVGEVEEVNVASAQPLLRVLRPTGEEVLIPAVPPLVVEIDREGNRLVVDPVPGLLDPGEADEA